MSRRNKNLIETKDHISKPGSIYSTKLCLFVICLPEISKQK